MAFGVLEGVLSLLLLGVGALLVLYIIYGLGKFIFGIMANIILGFIAIVLINIIFGIGIAFDLPVIIITALLGLPGVAVVIILRLLGISV